MSADSVRRQVLSRWRLRSFLWARLPLAAFAGLRVDRLDDARCDVVLPGGWRTRNPFGSTYFAAQTMAAEMSTGAPALLLASEASASTALIVVDVRCAFPHRLTGPGAFRFEDVGGMRAAVGRAAAQADPVTFVARSVGTDREGTTVAEVEVTWSFKRRHG